MIGGAAVAEQRRTRVSEAAEAEIDRVVVVSDDVSSAGGAGAVARKSIERIAAQGFNVTVLVGVASSAQSLPADVEVVPLFAGKVVENAGVAAAVNGVFDLGVRSRVAQWIAANDTPATIYHLHNWHKSLSPSVFHALRPVERRLAMTAHDYFLVCPNGSFYNFRSRKPCELQPLSGKCIGENCDKRRYAHKAWRVLRHGVRSQLFPLGASASWVLTPHEGVTPYLIRGGARIDRIRTVRNPVTPWTNHRVNPEKQRRVLFVGRLETDKGVHLAAEAADRCGISLTVIGDGPLKTPLAQAYPRHQFVGRKSRAEVSAIASEARMLVVAPLWPETFGLVTFEGLLSGIPTMVSRNALVAEELRHCDAAEVFNCEDPESFSASLSRLNNDVGRLTELSVNGFALRDKLAPGPEAWGRSLTGVYRAILEAAALK